jgi:hypothetical protein
LNRLQVQQDSTRGLMMMMPFICSLFVSYSALRELASRSKEPSAEWTAALSQIAVQSYQRSSEKTMAIFFRLLNEQLLQIAPSVTSLE